MRRNRGNSQPSTLRHTIDNQEENMPFSNRQLFLLRKMPLLSVRKVHNDKQFLKKRAQSIPILNGLRMDAVVTPAKNSTYNIHVAGQPQRVLQTAQRTRKDQHTHHRHQPIDKKMLGFQALLGTPLLKRMIERETIDMAQTCYSARTELEVAGASKQLSPIRKSHAHKRRASSGTFFMPPCPH